MSLDLPDLAEWRDAIYARIVEKVGDRQYWEHWAKTSPTSPPPRRPASAPCSITPSRTPSAANGSTSSSRAARTTSTTASPRRRHRDALPAPHHPPGVRRPVRRRRVREAQPGLPGHAGDARRPRRANLDAETETLDEFYDHIRMRVGGIDTAEGRQKIIAELYEKFFKIVVPKTAASLGIVYTPVEIVDFIIRASTTCSHEHFDGASLSDEGVHILDPFTGTGTFIARLLQSGLISPDDLPRKYASELHANEIVLLAYYIAAINIETAYRGRWPTPAADSTATSRSPGSSSPTPSRWPKTTTRWTPSSSPATTTEPTARRTSTSASSSATRPTPSASPARTTTTRTSRTRPSTPVDRAHLRQAIDRDAQELALRLLHPGDPLGVEPHPGLSRRRRRSDSSPTAAGSTATPPTASARPSPTSSTTSTSSTCEATKRTSGEQCRQGRRQGLRLGQPQHRRDHPSRQEARRSADRRRTDPLPRHRRLPHREEKLAIVDDSTVGSFPWRSIAPNDHADWVNQRSPLLRP